MSRERPKRGVLPPAQENIEKLKKVVEGGQLLWSPTNVQIYKCKVCHTDEECVLYCRYVSAQWHTDALDILRSGSCIQLEHGQVTCGAELPVLFVDTLVKARVPYNDESCYAFVLYQVI